MIHILSVDLLIFIDNDDIEINRTLDRSCQSSILLRERYVSRGILVNSLVVPPVAHPLAADPTCELSSRHQKA
jgi:hypothetical protein